MFFAVFLSYVKVVYAIIFCIGWFLCYSKTFRSRLLSVLFRLNVPPNLTSRSSLRKGAPKLEVCFCDCWCFLRFHVFSRCLRRCAFVAIKLIIFPDCVRLRGVCATHLPPPILPWGVFILKLLHGFFTFIPQTHWTESLWMLTWSAFCNVASVDTCSASVFVEARSYMRDSGLVPGWSLYVTPALDFRVIACAGLCVQNV